MRLQQQASQEDTCAVNCAPRRRGGRHDASLARALPSASRSIRGRSSRTQKRGTRRRSAASSSCWRRPGRAATSRAPGGPGLWYLNGRPSSRRSNTKDACAAAIERPPAGPSSARHGAADRPRARIEARGRPRQGVLQGVAHRVELVEAVDEGVCQRGRRAASLLRGAGRRARRAGRREGRQQLLTHALVQARLCRRVGRLDGGRLVWAQATLNHSDQSKGCCEGRVAGERPGVRRRRVRRSASNAAAGGRHECGLCTSRALDAVP